MTDQFYSGHIPTPIGRMIAVVNNHGAVVRLDFEEDRRRPLPVSQISITRHDDQAMAHIAEQLHEYFALERHRFELELAPRGTPFLQSAWQHLAQVPYGTMTTYGELAKCADRSAARRKTQTIALTSFPAKFTRPRPVPFTIIAACCVWH